MTSKRKVNGCTSVRCVEEAMKKCACDTWKFFFLATVDGKNSETFDVSHATELFSQFQREGAVMYPHYRIPTHVLRFAEKVHASKCPLQLARELWTFARMPVLKLKKIA